MTDRSHWFEEDDESLLESLLLGDTDGDEDGGRLAERLNGMKERLEQDLIRLAIGGNFGDRWWPSLLEAATSSGFSQSFQPSGPLNSNQPSSAGGSASEKESPKAFATSGGQRHLSAVCDLLGVTKERGVKLTLAALRTFASASASVSVNNKNDANENSSSDGDNERDSNENEREQQEKLRSLLGTKELFDRVIERHRGQFLARLRILTECLRLEQGYSGENEHDNNNTGKACASLLDTLDGKMTLGANNGKKRGLFHLLLRLACGPALPGMSRRVSDGGLPQSVARLDGTSSFGVVGRGSRRGAASRAAENWDGHGSDEFLLAVRTEATEALLVLLYDRIDGGAQRLDLFLLIEGASRCADIEFGMTPMQYAQILKFSIGRGSGIGGSCGDFGFDLGGENYHSGDNSSKMKHRLNGLWALVCAECMGLWRVNSKSASSIKWLEDHPLLLGFNFSQDIAVGSPSGNQRLGLSLRGFSGGGNDSTEKAMIEIDALCQKLHQLGEFARDRRYIAFNARSNKREIDRMPLDDLNEKQETLASLSADSPEGVALLSLGLFLHLAQYSCPSHEYLGKAGTWGLQCTKLANDECGAIDYLHKVLESFVRDPFRDASTSDGVNLMRQRAKFRVDKISEALTGRGSLRLLLDNSLVSMDEDHMIHPDEFFFELVGGDAASVVYASIGREILSSTIRAFREELLSLQRNSASENIGTLVDLCCVLHRHSSPICDQFWADWESFCQRNDEAIEDEQSDYSMCYLLDASHSLAASTCVELDNGTSRQPILTYLRPLSSFLNMIASLCSNASTVQNILSSDFLPRGLITKTMLLCAELSPQVASMNESPSKSATLEEKIAVTNAKIAIRSILNLALLGGSWAREWVRESFEHSVSHLPKGPAMLYMIASFMLPRKQHALEVDCSEVTSCSLRLLADLLTDASAEWHVEAVSCVASYPSFGEESVCGFAQFVAGGIHSEITLAAMSLLCSLSMEVTRNAFDPKIISSGFLPHHIETIGGGVMVGFEVLSTLHSGGEMSFPLSTIQIACAHMTISAIAAMLVGVKPVIYLHEDDATRNISFSVRNDIINALTTSTAVGKVIAFLASAPVTLDLMKSASTVREISQVIDTVSYNRVSSTSRNATYGGWSRFVTPKRASQRVRQEATPLSSYLGSDAKKGVKIGDDSFAVSEIALTLLLLWNEHAQDIASSHSSQDLHHHSPFHLLMSTAPLPSHQHYSMELSDANLNLISRFIDVDNALIGGLRSNVAILSAQLINSCLKNMAVASGFNGDINVGLSTFRAALRGGAHLHDILLSAFHKLVDDTSVSQQLEELLVMTSAVTEMVALCVEVQPDLARGVLMGGENEDSWKLVDLMATSLQGVPALLKSYSEDELSDEKLLILRCTLALESLHVLSKLWKKCRLACNQTVTSDNAHPCGSATFYLANLDKKGSPVMIANTITELIRSSLHALVFLEDKKPSDDETSVQTVHYRSLFLDMLTRSLDVITIETVARVQAQPKGVTDFVEDFSESALMECWSLLLSSFNAATLATPSWIRSVGSFSNWSVGSFLRVYPASDTTAASSWCSFDEALLWVQVISLRDIDIVDGFVECHALHCLAQAEAAFCSAWAPFFEVIVANSVTTRPGDEVWMLRSGVLVESILNGIETLSHGILFTESLVTSHVGPQAPLSIQPLVKLCSLLSYSLMATTSIGLEDGGREKYQRVFEMLSSVHNSANKLFAITHCSSASVLNTRNGCLIHLKLLNASLSLLSNLDNYHPDSSNREEVSLFSNIRIGLAGLAVTSLQILQNRPEGNEMSDAYPLKFTYDFRSATEYKSEPQHSDEKSIAFQLLRTSISLLTRLAPNMMSKVGDYQSNAYGADFAKCLRQSNALDCLKYHLETATSVATLTYQPAHNASTNSLTQTMHRNSVDVVALIAALVHTLTDFGSEFVDILLILVENQIFRSLIDCPLLKKPLKILVSTSSANLQPEERLMTTIKQYRGYCAPAKAQNHHISANTKKRPSSESDGVHLVWRLVIRIFSSLLRSTRCQCSIYEKVDENVLRSLLPAMNVVFDFLCTFENELLSCFSSMFHQFHTQDHFMGKAKSKSNSIPSSPFGFTYNLLLEAEAISSLFSELCKGEAKLKFALSCDDTFKRILSSTLDLTKITSSFLGSLGNAREILTALSNASSLSYDQPSFMFNAHPVLAEGIPNARHEAIRNAHFASSCCICATVEDYAKSQVCDIKTTKMKQNNEEIDSSNFEQSFQIRVNNVFIVELERVAGHCLINALAVLMSAHPAFDSFSSFTAEEARRLDVAALISPGTIVAIRPQTIGNKYLNSHSKGSEGFCHVRYAQALRCDRSNRTLLVAFFDSGFVEERVPWSWLVGMEDTSKRRHLLSYSPAPNSISEEAATSGQLSIGHLIFVLRWCRYSAYAKINQTDRSFVQILSSLAERAALLLSTEVLLHSDQEESKSLNENAQKVNEQLLDLFESSKCEHSGSETAPSVESGNLSAVLEKEVLKSVQYRLKRQLQSAAIEREEERKNWEQNSGWETNANFWAGGTKREGRRSPFRAFQRQVSSDSFS
ncbi:hypothetical protein ACHAXS_008626 [Conticribra weissflogii]